MCVASLRNGTSADKTHNSEKHTIPSKETCFVSETNELVDVPDAGHSEYSDSVELQRLQQLASTVADCMIHNGYLPLWVQFHELVYM